MADQSDLLTSDDDSLELRGTVIDRVGDTYVVEGEVVSAARERRQAVGGDQGLQANLVTGAAEIEIDAYSNRLLVRPRGLETVRIRPRLDAPTVQLSGSDLEIGIEPTELPPDEGDFEAVGGGACSARWQLGIAVEFDVHVRAAVTSTVLPLSLERRRLNWRHGLYFAHDPNVGFMRLNYNPSYYSHLEMTSKQSAPAADSFFPSEVENDLYFICDFVDFGFKAFNKEPMQQRVNEVGWPPFSEDVVLSVTEPLDFYDFEDPERLIMTITSQEMRLYDYDSLDVELLQSDVGDDGLVTGKWRITNQSDEIVRARWFALGEFRHNSQPSEGNRLLGPSGSGLETYEIDTALYAQPSSLPQRMTMNAVSVTGSILAGRTTLEYQYPLAS